MSVGPVGDALVGLWLPLAIVSFVVGFARFHAHLEQERERARGE